MKYKNSDIRRKAGTLPRPGEGKRGPITERLQKLFFGLFDGSTVDRWNWLEPIDDRAEQKPGRIDRPIAV